MEIPSKFPCMEYNYSKQIRGTNHITKSKNKVS